MSDTETMPRPVDRPKRPAPVVDPATADALLARAEAQGVDLLGPDGLLSQVTKAVLERALGEELTVHLGYKKHDPAGRGSGNSRNGATSKRLLTEVGPVDLEVPRDRNGSFEPQIVRKGQTRLDGFNDRIIALYARGLTTRDIRPANARPMAAKAPCSPTLRCAFRSVRPGTCSTNVRAPQSDQSQKNRCTVNNSATGCPAIGRSADRQLLCRRLDARPHRTQRADRLLGCAAIVTTPPAVAMPSTTSGDNCGSRTRQQQPSIAMPRPHHDPNRAATGHDRSDPRADVLPRLINGPSRNLCQNPLSGALLPRYLALFPNMCPHRRGVQGPSLQVRQFIELLRWCQIAWQSSAT